MMLDSSSLSDGEHRMAVSDALGQHGSKCVTAASWKPPMMAWALSAAVTSVLPTMRPESARRFPSWVRFSFPCSVSHFLRSLRTTK
jgi:hypothetical protein